MDSLRKLKHLIILAAVVGAVFAAPTASRAEDSGLAYGPSPVGNGCYTSGDVDGYREFNECHYTAQTTTQTMYITSANRWRAYVVRSIYGPTYCFNGTEWGYFCNGYTDTQVDLGSGYGPLLDANANPRTDEPIQVHPNPGEVVYLDLFGDCYPGLSTTCGKVGMLGAYE